MATSHLSGHAYAADYWDRDRAEWPPHPARFFSALMDACYAADLQDLGLHALRWLEQQGAPAIAASEAHERQRTIIGHVADLHFTPMCAMLLTASEGERHGTHFRTLSSLSQ
jgi:CRISPR-associated protein Csb2